MKSIILISLLIIMSALASSLKSSTSIKIDELLTIVKRLSPVQQRGISAIVGSAVADAATRPFHWLYDRAKLEEIVQDRDPEFWPTSQSPFYTLETGRRSCYNDICYCMLRSLDPSKYNNGGYDKDSFVKSIVSLFASPSEYSQAWDLRQKIAAYDPAKRLSERAPIPGPWQQQSVTSFLSNVEKNEFDGNPEVKETDGLMATIPIIARLSVEGVDIKSSKVIGDAASLLSSNQFCIRHTYAAASILQEAIASGVKLNLEQIISLIPKDDEIDQQIIEELKNVTIAYNNNENYSNAVHTWGKQCANPGSFQGSVYSIVTSNNFCDGIRKTIIAGGCNCSRANYIGCVLGAIYGFDEDVGINKSWLEKTDKSIEILELAINLICK